MTKPVKVFPLWIAAWMGLQSAPARAQVILLHSFGGGNADGAGPLGALTHSGAFLYGTAESGGSSADAGTLFKIGVDGTGYGVTHTFTNGLDGGSPFGSLTQNLSILYGTTVNAGSAGQGTIFKIGVDGTDFGVVHAFMGSPTDGSNPQGSLVQSGSTFYGTTTNGGSAGGGTIFKVNADGTSETVLHSFVGGSNDGQNPTYGAPALSGTNLYGMTISGGSTGSGVIYKIGTDGTGFTVLHSFTFAPGDGNTPFGSVIVSGSTIYGLTSIGGTSGNGTIFKINVDGTGFTLLHSFGGQPSDGRGPLGELLLSNSNLYGTTYQGGTANLGTLFSIGIDGSNYDVMHSLAGGPTDGANPYSDLILIGSNFYGTSVFGGTSNNGTIFSFTPVPEPSSLLLVGSAASVAAWAIRRRRRRQSNTRATC